MFSSGVVLACQSHSARTAIVADVVVAVDMEFVVVVVETSRPTIVAHCIIQEHCRFTFSTSATQCFCCILWQSNFVIAVMDGRVALTGFCQDRKCSNPIVLKFFGMLIFGRGRFAALLTPRENGQCCRC